MGGWVENILPTRSPARNGLAIIMCDCAAIFGSGGSGAAWVPRSSFRNADARANGSPVSSAPDWSAWYSATGRRRA